MDILDVIRMTAMEQAVERDSSGMNSCSDIAQRRLLTVSAVIVERDDITMEPTIVYNFRVDGCVVDVQTFRSMLEVPYPVLTAGML